MLNAQQRQKHYYDKRHVPSVLKWAHKYCLPLQTFTCRPLVLATLYPDGLGLVQSQLALVQVHKVFQVSLIKQYRTDVRTQPPPPPVDDCTKRTVEQVLDHRVVRRGRQQKIGYLISWVSYAAESNT